MPSMLPFTEEDFAPAWQDARGTASGAGRFEGRRGVQRHLLVHPGRLLHHGRASRAERVLGRRGGVGDPFGRRRQGHRRVDRRRHTVHRRARVRPVPLRGRGPQPASSSCRPARRPSSRSTTSSTPTSSGARCADCAPARSITASANSARSSTRAGAGNARPGSRRTPNWRNGFAPTGLASRIATTGRRGSGRRSPIAEAHWTREHVAMYDMTPLTRYEVAGPGAVAFLQRMTTNNVDKSVGSVTYTLLLDETGGIRSDITVARLGERPRSRSAPTAPLDFDWFSRHLPERASPCGTSPAAPAVSACGVRWPATWCSRCVPTTCRTRRSSTSAPSRPTSTRSRSPCCGSPTSANSAGRSTPAPNTVRRCGICWPTPASAHGVIAAGRIAFNSLRIEKGYRLWGTDMTAEHQPAAAGLDFAVRMAKDDFIGKAGTGQDAGKAAAQHRLRRSGRRRAGQGAGLPSTGAVRRLRHQRRLFGHRRAHHRLRVAARRTSRGRLRHRRLSRHPVHRRRPRRTRGGSRDGPDQEVAQ